MSDRSSSTAAVAQGATILIIDDVPANVAVLAECLEDHGLRVVVAEDGEEGLQRAAFVKPDLILLDVMMPGLDGFETCRRLKRTPAIQNIPVVFMTALADTQSVVEAFRAGGVDYVTKPIQVEEVLARIGNHLALRRMHRQVIEQNLALREEVAARQQAEDELRQLSRRQQGLIDKLQQAHDQLLQAEKMASIGQLAAGMAHEINNPLSFVHCNLGTLRGYFDTVFAALADCEQVLARVPADAAASAELARIRQDAELDFLRQDIADVLDESTQGLDRVAHIVRALRDFAHEGESVWQQVDLHQGLESTLCVVDSEIRPKADVVREYGELPLVTGLPSQLNQVFMHLLVNAAQAISQRGTITLRTTHDNEWVRIEVCDTGGGIAPEIVHRIFEPFFTTKRVGSGSGLGLSLSYGVVRQHGGRIDVRSEPGRGSCFTVHLPVRQPAG